MSKAQYEMEGRLIQQHVPYGICKEDDKVFIKLGLKFVNTLLCGTYVTMDISGYIKDHFLTIGINLPKNIDLKEVGKLYPNMTLIGLDLTTEAIKYYIEKRMVAGRSVLQDGQCYQLFVGFDDDCKAVLETQMAPPSKSLH